MGLRDPRKGASPVRGPAGLTRKGGRSPRANGTPETKRTLTYGHTKAGNPGNQHRNEEETWSVGGFEEKEEPAVVSGRAGTDIEKLQRGTGPSSSVLGGTPAWGNFTTITKVDEKTQNKWLPPAIVNESALTHVGNLKGKTYGLAASHH